MTKLLESVTAYHGGGTASNMSISQYIDTAGKTGTSSSDFDRWFIGYTPYYLGGVWVGYDNNTALSSFVSNPASNIWNEVMTRIHAKYIESAERGETELRKFSLSPGVVEITYCNDPAWLPPPNAKALLRDISRQARLRPKSVKSTLKTLQIQKKNNTKITS